MITDIHISQEIFANDILIALKPYLEHNRSMFCGCYDYMKTRLQLKILNQAASTRCSGDNKEKLSANIRREYASDFCHDRISALINYILYEIALVLLYKQREIILQLPRPRNQLGRVVILLLP